MPNTFRVIREGESAWVVRDSRGGMILSGQTFPTREAALEAAFRLLKAEGLEARITHDGQGNINMLTYPAVGPPADIRLTLPGPAADAFRRALAKTGDKPGEALGKAIGLYLMALDARDRGKVVGAADGADKLETEFTGF